MRETRRKVLSSCYLSASTICAGIHRCSGSDSDLVLAYNISLRVGKCAKDQGSGKAMMLHSAGLLSARWLVEGRALR